MLLLMRLLTLPRAAEVLAALDPALAPALVPALVPVLALAPVLVPAQEPLGALAQEAQGELEALEEALEAPVRQQMILSYLPASAARCLLAVPFR